MAKCKKCGRGGFFFKVNAKGYCHDCTRLEALQAEQAYLSENIEQFNAVLAKNKQEYEELKQNKEAVYNELLEKAKTDALAALEKQITVKNNKLQNIANEIEESQKRFEALAAEQAKTEKTITSNANKLLKIQTIFKSLQYSAKRYSDTEQPSAEILNETVPGETDELLSTTVKLKFNLMDIRELRKRYNQNSKIIKELLVKYQGRYTTKTNMTI